MRIIIIAWIICGIFGQAIHTGYFFNKYIVLQSRKEFRRDIRQGMLLGLAGPVGLIVQSLMSDWGRYGLIFFWESYEKCKK